MPDMITPASAETFHEGERTVQANAGVSELLINKLALEIRDVMPDQHRMFFAQLPFVIIGSVEISGQPWASLLANSPGFITSPQHDKLVITAVPRIDDPLYNALVLGAPIALLGIEQHTRRRNRMNGKVTAISRSGFAVTVQQSFGNCPKYIQARQAIYQPHKTAPLTCYAACINLAMRRIIETADTFFIASSHPQAHNGQLAAHGVDVSHRGGKPGFVKIIGADTLLVPDFSGNRMFNTLGNISLNPLAGLLFIDFVAGDLLQLSVRAEIVYDAALLREFAGAERILKFTITQCLFTRAGADLHWDNDVQLSPFLAHTGSW